MQSQKWKIATRVCLGFRNHSWFTQEASGRKNFMRPWSSSALKKKPQIWQWGGKIIIINQSVLYVASLKQLIEKENVYYSKEVSLWKFGETSSDCVIRPTWWDITNDVDKIYGVDGDFFWIPPYFASTYSQSSHVHITLQHTPNLVILSFLGCSNKTDKKKSISYYVFSFPILGKAKSDKEGFVRPLVHRTSILVDNPLRCHLVSNSS